MPVFKNDGNGTWYVMARYVNWKGERKQKCKRGFATKREAQEWERKFQLQNSADLDMDFESFAEIYTNDIKNRLKENTWLTKEHIIPNQLKKFNDLSQTPIILVSQVIRGYFSKMITQFYPGVYVLSFNEITSAVQIQAIGNITLEPAPRTERRAVGT